MKAIKSKNVSDKCDNFTAVEYFVGENTVGGVNVLSGKKEKESDSILCS